MQRVVKIGMKLIDVLLILENNEVILALGRRNLGIF